jgi:hypothetical protein
MSPDIQLTQETVKRLRSPKAKNDEISKIMKKEGEKQVDEAKEAKRAQLKSYMDVLTSRFHKVELLDVDNDIELVTVKFAVAPKKRTITWSFYWECVDAEKLHEIISREKKSRARTK